MKLKYIHNPLAKDKRTEIDFDYNGESLKELCKEYISKSTKDLAIIISGKKVDWDYKIQPGDEIIFITDITSGGNGGIFQAIAGIVLVAAAVITYNYNPYAPQMIMMGIGLMASGAASAMFGATIPSTTSGDFDSSQTYSWDGISNLIGEGNSVPLVYGRHRVGGALIEGFVDGDSEDGLQNAEFLNLLVALSEGPIEEIETNTILLNNNDIRNYISDDFAEDTTIISDPTYIPVGQQITISQDDLDIVKNYDFAFDIEYLGSAEKVYVNSYSGNSGNNGDSGDESTSSSTTQSSGISGSGGYNAGDSPTCSGIAGA